MKTLHSHIGLFNTHEIGFFNPTFLKSLDYTNPIHRCIVQSQVAKTVLNFVTVNPWAMQSSVFKKCCIDQIDIAQSLCYLM